jgi:chaperone required for assembly of F1-ATPase
MASPRFQFRLSTLLWITLFLACFFGGMAIRRNEMEAEQTREQRRLDHEWQVSTRR